MTEKRFTNQDVLDEIDAYQTERGFSDRLKELAKRRFLDAQQTYEDTWQTWSVERHNKEALEELADYINYQVFIRILKRDGGERSKNPESQDARAYGGISIRSDIVEEALDVRDTLESDSEGDDSFDDEMRGVFQSVGRRVGYSGTGYSDYDDRDE